MLNIPIEISSDQTCFSCNGLLGDLENIDVKLENENKSIILPNTLSKSYEHLKDAILFDREHKISMDEVQYALDPKIFKY